MDNKILSTKIDSFEQKLINIALISLGVFIISYIFMPDIRNDYFEILLNILIAVASYIIYDMFIRYYI